MNGGTRFDPVEDSPCGVVSRERNPHTTMGSRVVGDHRGAMNEKIPRDLHAPRHGCVVIKAGMVVCILETRSEVASWCAMPRFSGADAGPDNDPVSLISTQRLISQVDLDPFRTAAEISPVLFAGSSPALAGRRTALCLKICLCFREEPKQRVVIPFD